MCFYIFCSHLRCLLAAVQKKWKKKLCFNIVCSCKFIKYQFFIDHSSHDNDHHVTLQEPEKNDHQSLLLFFYYLVARNIKRRPTGRPTKEMLATLMDDDDHDDGDTGLDQGKVAPKKL